jgi:hypothetical protein
MLPTGFSPHESTRVEPIKAASSSAINNFRLMLDDSWLRLSLETPYMRRVDGDCVPDAGDNPLPDLRRPQRGFPNVAVDEQTHREAWSREIDQ